MASAQETYYRSYRNNVASKNVQPIVYERGELHVDLDGETWALPDGGETLSPAWGDREYGPVRVYVSSLGRVLEVQSIMGGLSSVRAIHRTRADYDSYRRPLGMFHYLNT